MTDQRELVRRLRAELDERQAPDEREVRAAYEKTLQQAECVLEQLRDLWPSRRPYFTDYAWETLERAESAAGVLVALLLDMRPAMLGDDLDSALRGIQVDGDSCTA